MDTRDLVDATLPTQTSAAGASRGAALGRGELVGRFVVLDELGAGGMGVVYRAYDPMLDRQLALKLVRVGDARDRAYREAQALAQLSHPNVVSVYDVGAYEDWLFIAIELVDGQTLRDWLRQPRSQAEILAAFEAAGRGLAAAHRAGLVHRDVKPANILVGNDGRVRMADFGLARTAGDAGEGAVVAPAREPRSPTDSEARLLDSPLTRDGLIVGTPVYMAPEQREGQTLDERTDQFSFCVALYEALYHERPFAESEQEGDWRPRPAPAGSEVPEWLRAVVVRGLSRDPAARYPSMDALLDALGDDPLAARRRRRATFARVLAIAAVAAVIGGGAVAMYAGQRDRVGACETASGRLARVWNGAAAQRVLAAFDATGVPYATQAAAGVTRALDRYVEDWRVLRRDACAAQRDGAGSSAPLTEASVLCLDRLVFEVRALTDVFVAADAGVVEHAVRAAQSLTGVQSCAEVARLRSEPALRPEDREAVTAIDSALARVKALHHTARYEEAMAPAQQAAERAAAIAGAPRHAEALYWLARLREEQGDYAAAESGLIDALFAAERAGDDASRVDALARLTYVVGYRRARYDEAHRFAGQGLALLDRLGGLERERAELLSNRGTVYFAQSRFDEALDHDERALALRTRALGAEHLAVADSLNNLGLLYCDTGACARAREPLERALALRTRALGEEHPMTAGSLSNLGLALYKLGELDRAGETYRRALEIRERSLGPDHPRLAYTHEGLGVVYLAQGALARALAHYRRSLEIREGALGAEHPDVAYSLDGVGDVLTAAGEFDQARAMYTRSLDILEAAFGTDNADYGLTLASIGALERARGRWGAAVARSREAIAVLEPTLGADHPEVALARYELGLALAQLGDAPAATRQLSLARDTCARAACRPGMAPQIASALATLAPPR